MHEFFFQTFRQHFSHVSLSTRHVYDYDAIHAEIKESDSPSSQYENKPTKRKGSTSLSAPSTSQSILECGTGITYICFVIVGIFYRLKDERIFNELVKMKTFVAVIFLLIFADAIDGIVGQKGTY